MKYLEDFKISKTHFQMNLCYRSTTPYDNSFHAHQGIEFMYIHEGTGQIVLNETIHKVEPGKLFIFQPFQLHGVQMDVSEAQPFYRTMIMIDPTFLEKHLETLPELLLFFRYLWQRDLTHQILERMNDTLLEQVLPYFKKRMLGASDEKRKHETVLMMIDMLHIIQSEWSANFHGQIEKPLRHSERVMLWIDKHYQQPFHMDDLTRDLHLSKSYLSHQFKAETGSSISDYLIARRIREACLMLSTTAMDIREIGAEVGMPIPSYFTKKFKEIVGVTPKAYRKNVSALRV